MLLGAMVATAIIAGSLAIGDTLERMGNDWVRCQQGEVDHIVTVTAADQGREGYLSRKLAHESISLEQLNAETRAAHGEALVDGVLPVIQEKAPVQKVDPATGKAILGEPSVMVLAVDWEELGRFGAEPPSLPRPAPGEMLASRPLARELELSAGDAVQLFAGNRGHTFTVKEVVKEQGISGWSGGEISLFSDLGGTLLMGLDDGQEVFAGGADQVNAVFVSNTGGVFDGAKNTSRVGESLEGLVLSIDTPGELRVKSLQSDEAANEGGIIAFAIMGFSSFAIIAGIMLLVNIYGMLAEERRSEMGALRALGAARWQLVRAYLYEGFLYSLGASAVGLLMGVGFAALVMASAVRLFSDSLPQVWEAPVFHVEPASMMLAASAGVLVTLITLAFASVRVTNIDPYSRHAGTARAGRAQDPPLDPGGFRRARRGRHTAHSCRPI